jgi:uncharacterized repeat protein (TIGR03833 family)
METNTIFFRCTIMDSNNRASIYSGIEVLIVQKRNHNSGSIKRGIVKDILTNSTIHPHGIKVRLESGEIGRVKEIIAYNGRTTQ